MLSLTCLVIHFNNPVALHNTLERMIKWKIEPDRILVLDNSSNAQNAQDAEVLCSGEGVHFIPSTLNRGWGGAINYVLESIAWTPDDLLLIAAHDALIEKLDEKEIEHVLQDEDIAFVCPQYPDPIICRYSLLKSFYCVSGHVVGEVPVGQFTAAIVRPQIIKQVRFDEEYFIYGCEFDIFLRVSRAGYKIVLSDDFVVSNPSTDSSSMFAITAYTVNSMYTAYIDRRWYGMIVRGAVILLSVIRLLLSKQVDVAIRKLSCFAFGITNPGKGFRTFRSRRTV